MSSPADKRGNTTRDIVQNIYIRRVKMIRGEPWAVEFATFEAVKDPLKEAAAK